MMLHWPLNYGIVYKEIVCFYNKVGLQNVDF